MPSPFQSLKKKTWCPTGYPLSITGKNTKKNVRDLKLKYLAGTLLREFVIINKISSLLNINILHEQMQVIGLCTSDCFLPHCDMPLGTLTLYTYRPGTVELLYFMFHMSGFIAVYIYL